MRMRGDDMGAGRWRLSMGRGRGDRMIIDIVAGVILAILIVMAVVSAYYATHPE